MTSFVYLCRNSEWDEEGKRKLDEKNLEYRERIDNLLAKGDLKQVGKVRLKPTYYKISENIYVNIYVHNS